MDLIDKLISWDIPERYFGKTSHFKFSGIFITCENDIVAQLELGDSRYLAKISSTGSLRWVKKYLWSCIAAGKKEIYMFQFGPSFGGMTVLQKIDLESGICQSSSTVFGPQFSEWGSGRVKGSLSGGERFLAVSCGTQLLCILESSTGKLVEIAGVNTLSYITAGLACLNFPEYGSGSSDFIEHYWRIDGNFFLYRYIYDVSKGRYHQTKITDIPTPNSFPGRCVDLQSKLNLEEQLDENWDSIFLVKPFYGRLDGNVSPGTRCSPRLLTVPMGERGYRKNVRFPPAPYHEGYRCVFEFLRMYNGFLVFHDEAQGRLMVVDFRPPWYIE